MLRKLAFPTHTFVAMLVCCLQQSLQLLVGDVFRLPCPDHMLTMYITESHADKPGTLLRQARWVDMNVRAKGTKTKKGRVSQGSSEKARGQ